MLMLICVSTASARPIPAIVSTHHAVTATHHWQGLSTGGHWTRYHGGAEMATTPAARWAIAGAWWAHAWDAYHYYQAHPLYVAVSGGSCLAAIHAYFPSYAWPAAVAIATRESGLSASAKNPTSSASGCFQLMSFWWDGSSAYGWVFDPFNAQQNVSHAYLMWRADGGSFCPGQWCL